jgi:hypothetical protein
MPMAARAHLQPLRRLVEHARRAFVFREQQRDHRAPRHLVGAVAEEILEGRIRVRERVALRGRIGERHRESAGRQCCTT